MSFEAWRISGRIPEALSSVFEVENKTKGV